MSHTCACSVDNTAYLYADVALPDPKQEETLCSNRYCMPLGPQIHLSATFLERYQCISIAGVFFCVASCLSPSLKEYSMYSMQSHL